MGLDVPVTPEDWLPVLAARLDAETAGTADRLGIKKLRDYATGTAPVPEGRKNLQESWQAFQKKARTNYGGLAVETVASRIIPLSVTVGDDDQSDLSVAARRVWRDNRMRSQIRSLVRDRLTVRVGYLLVSPGSDGKATVTREAPETFIALPEPLAPWRARAALKVWKDDVTGTHHATVWAGPWMQHFSRDAVSNGVARTTVRDGWAPDGDPVDSGFDHPPVVRSARPENQSLFEPHIDVIDRINLGKLNRLVIAAYQAFRQRAIKPGADHPDGLPQLDDDGNAIDWAKILEPAPGAMWDFPVPIDIWESKEADIRGLLEAERQDAREFAAVMRLPVSVFSPEGANQSGTGADITREGLVSTAGDEISDLRAAVEVAMVYALQAEKRDIQGLTLETSWEPPAYVSVGEKYAAAAQAKAAGLSRRTIMREILGFSDEKIMLEEQSLADEMLQTMMFLGDQNADLG